MNSILLYTHLLFMWTIDDSSKNILSPSRLGHPQPPRPTLPLCPPTTSPSPWRPVKPRQVDCKGTCPSGGEDQCAWSSDASFYTIDFDLEFSITSIEFAGMPDHRNQRPVNLFADWMANLTETSTGVYVTPQVSVGTTANGKAVLQFRNVFVAA